MSCVLRQERRGTRGLARIRPPRWGAVVPGQPLGVGGPMGDLLMAPLGIRSVYSAPIRGKGGVV